MLVNIVCSTKHNALPSDASKPVFVAMFNQNFRTPLHSLDAKFPRWRLSMADITAWPCPQEAFTIMNPQGTIHGLRPDVNA
jgi:hypothetical protein